MASAAMSSDVTGVETKTCDSDLYIGVAAKVKATEAANPKSILRAIRIRF